MAMHHMIECSDDCSRKIGSLWQYFRNGPDNSIGDFKTFKFKALCYLQFMKNTKYVRIVLNHFYKLINPISSAKTMRILRSNGILLFNFTLLSTML